MINVARKYFYPALTVSATGGITSTSLSQMFSPSSVFWNIVGGLTQPIFKPRTKQATPQGCTG